MTQERLVTELKAAGWDTCNVRTIQRYESGEITTPLWIGRLALERVFGMPVEMLGFPSAAAVSAVLRPETFYIFDRVDGDAEAVNRRTASCWSWCERVNAVCLDEFIAWGDDARQSFPLILVDAIQACRNELAALLVHTVERLGEPGVVWRVLAQLGDLQLWTVQPVAQRVTLDMIPMVKNNETETETNTTAPADSEEEP